MSAREPDVGSVSIPENARGPVEVPQREFRWTIAEGFRDAPDRLLSTPGELVKQSGPGKSVTRHVTPAGTYYIKRYRHEAFGFRPLKFFFKASQAKQEWDAARELGRAGIPVVRHVALGERWSPRGLLESVLITEEFAGAPLDEAPGFDLRRVVDFVRALAAAGFFHRDFHPANILVNQLTGEIRLVDLYGVTKRRGDLADLLEREMLGQLCITTPCPVPPEIRAHGLALRKRALAHRSRRCLHTNRDFEKRGASLQWHLRRDALSPELEKILSCPDGFVSEARMLKDGRSTTVVAGGGIVLKRYNFSRWLRPLKDVFRTPRAINAYRKAYHLELCGIPTARPLAAATERRLGLPRRGFVLMQEIPGSHLGVIEGHPQVVAREIGTLIAKLHHEGFSHRDLKETNILFDPAMRACLIDLEGLVFETDVPNATAGANLRRLAGGARACGKLNRTTVIAFLLSYCRTRAIKPSDLSLR